MTARQDRHVEGLNTWQRMEGIESWAGPGLGPKVDSWAGTVSSHSWGSSVPQSAERGTRTQAIVAAGSWSRARSAGLGPGEETDLCAGDEGSVAWSFAGAPRMRREVKRRTVAVPNITGVLLRRMALVTSPAVLEVVAAAGLPRSMCRRMDCADELGERRGCPAPGCRGSRSRRSSGGGPWATSSAGAENTTA